MKDKKITNLKNGQSRETPARQTLEAVVTSNAQDTSTLAVTILEDLPLGDDERDLPAKGPKLILITTLTDELTVTEDSEKFLKRPSLKAHFTETAAQTQENAVSVDYSQHETERNVTTPPTSTSEENSSHVHNISTEIILQDLNSKRSKWSPLPGKFSALDHYIDKCRREIDQLNFKGKCNQCNLTRAELAALRNLQNTSDVVIRPADKGGAFVVRLTDNYQTVDFTNAYPKTPEAFITHAIAKQELPQSANNLVVQHPRTSKFYLLPKIHKPGNPGRPIVSACQCLSELLTSYFNKVTAPFVRGLDSYVKDISVRSYSKR